MAQQRHRSLYKMVVIVIFGNMNLLPIMNIGVQSPAARETVRSPVRNCAGKMTRARVQARTRPGKSILDFGG
ncbi:hypothetical protein [Bradyrhizobium sp. McL0616]|uniref:hypothetical protein n=1 Tax=Bradyrhizobium sp. McL0616 TaxID=3415674 RepID=UPI003CF88658